MSTSSVNLTKRAGVKWEAPPHLMTTAAKDLLCPDATVDDESVAADVGGLVAAEPEDGVGDLLGAARACMGTTSSVSPLYFCQSALSSVTSSPSHGCWPYSSILTWLKKSGVATGPGATALARM